MKDKIINLSCLNCGRYLNKSGRKNKYFCSRRCITAFTHKAQKHGMTARQLKYVKTTDEI